MLIDISINPKSLDALVRFEITNLTDEKSYKDSIAVISIIAADYDLDPELEISDLKDMVKMALDQTKAAIIFEIHEDGIEAEISN